MLLCSFACTVSFMVLFLAFYSVYSKSALIGSLRIPLDKLIAMGGSVHTDFDCYDAAGKSKAGTLRMEMRLNTITAAAPPAARAVPAAAPATAPAGNRGVIKS